MASQVEEQEAAEFLKRAEIITMKKDLSALREADALKERDKIAKIKTLEEQLQEKNKADEAKLAQTKEKFAREEVLEKNAGEEKIAEKDLKNFATEQERQQIFLLESQRLGFEKQIDEIDQKKDPAVKLEKNNLLLKKREWQAKLDAILADEKKLEGEQNFVAEKSQTTTIPEEKKGLEERRWEIDKQIQDIEKKRWEVERQMEEIDKQTTEKDTSSERLVQEKNSLRDKVLGINKSLREIYSSVMEREEVKRAGLAQEQLQRKEVLAKSRLEEKEKVQRQQWTGAAVKMHEKDEGYLSKAPEAVRKKILETGQKEEEQREKFLHNVETWSGEEKSEPKILQDRLSNIPAPQPKTEVPVPPPPPPAPKRK
jgi:hypothetical protein